MLLTSVAGTCEHIQKEVVRPKTKGTRTAAAVVECVVPWSSGASNGGAGVVKRSVMDPRRAAWI